MTRHSKNGLEYETPLEAGLRRYAPRKAPARVRMSDFIMSLLLPDRSEPRQ